MHAGTYFFVPPCSPAYLHIYFTHETCFGMTRHIVPRVRVISTEIEARFSLVEVIRLESVPVGVGHRRQRLAARRRCCHSPDERRVTRRVDALSSRPEIDSLNAVSRTSAQRCP